MSRNATSDARKKDTRDKIELGGLIVKAGLRFEAGAFARRIDRPAEAAEVRRKGANTIDGDRGGGVRQ